jgi:hypothetical protein
MAKRFGIQASKIGLGAPLFLIGALTSSLAWGQVTPVVSTSQGAMQSTIQSTSQTTPSTAEPQYPKRKPGLWEIKTVASQQAGLPPTFYCIGPETDSAKLHLDRQASVEGPCKFGSFTKVGNGWLSESVCKEGKTNVVSRSLAAGDFEKEYRIDTFVSYSPPIGNGKREDKEALVASYLGDCRPGQKVGEMFIPGMGYISMVDGTVRPIQEAKTKKKK